MSNRPIVSVVIPCHNAQQWISETLQSVFAQNLGDLEVIVVDDGSTDDSADIVSSQFSSVKLIQTTNQGGNHARNLGTAVSTGDFIQFLDADDLLAADKLANHVRCLVATGADVVYGDWQKLVRNSSGNFVLGDIVARHFTGSPACELLGDFWCPPAGFLFRRTIVEKVGGWNERLTSTQDWRFVVDCALHGGKFVHCPGISALYRCQVIGSVSTRNPMELVRNILKNTEEIEGTWRQSGGLTRERRRALILPYEHVARSTYERDRPTFDAAYSHLISLDPHYCPSRPWHLACASRVLGYRRAEALAVIYRRAKRALRFQVSTVD